jgi:hypothetical protein
MSVLRRRRYLGVSLADHLALAGEKVDGVNPTFPDQGVTPSLQLRS